MTSWFVEWRQFSVGGETVRGLGLIVLFFYELIPIVARFIEIHREKERQARIRFEKKREEDRAKRQILLQRVQSQDTVRVHVSLERFLLFEFIGLSDHSFSISW